MGLTCGRNTESAMRYWANMWITELKHWCDFFHTLSSFVATSKKRFGNEKWQPACNSSCLCVAAHAYMMSLHGERERVRWWSKSLLSLSQLAENNLIFRVLATLEMHRKGWRAVCCSRASSFASVTLKWTLCWKNAVTEQPGMHEHRTSENEAVNSPQACYVWKCASVLEFRC